MEKMINFPQIGIGPGILGYKPNRRKQYKLYDICYRGYNRLIGKRILEKDYVNSLSNALKVGFRLIDYSAAYGSGELVGRAIKKSGIPREELYVTTRVSNHAQFHNNVRGEFLNCIQNLGVEYVDILQFHWPVTGLYLNTWREMEKLYEEGYVKNLGVANCHQHHLEEIFRICKYSPKVGQFEIHPLFTQKPLIQYYKEKGIIVEAYTPLARYDDRLVRLPLLKQMERKYGKTFVQIVLRWHIQNGIIPLVRSLSLKHQRENYDIFDFKLDETDMKAIDGININSRLRYDPDNCDFSIL